MEKQIIREKLHTKELVQFGGSVVDFNHNFSKFVSDIIEHNPDYKEYFIYFDPYTYVEIIGERFETDDELKYRTIHEEKIREKELTELKRLLEKYGEM